MKNLTGTGKTIAHTAAATITAGDPIKTGDSIGIAAEDAASGAVVTLNMVGEYEVVKTTGTAWTAGEKIDYDASASAFDTGITPASGDVVDCGYAGRAAASGAAVGYVVLTPGNGTGS